LEEFIHLSHAPQLLPQQHSLPLPFTIGAVFNRPDSGQQTTSTKSSIDPEILKKLSRGEASARCAADDRLQSRAVNHDQQPDRLAAPRGQHRKPEIDRQRVSYLSGLSGALKLQTARLQQVLATDLAAFNAATGKAKVEAVVTNEPHRRISLVASNR
jgi:hypothetical protein